MTDFTVTAEAPDAAERTTVAVAGELDVATVDVLRSTAMGALTREGCTTLVIDLGGVTFLDSSGLGMLLTLRNNARERGAGFAVVNVPPVAARVIDVAGLSNALSADETRTVAR